MAIHSILKRGCLAFLLVVVPTFAQANTDIPSEVTLFKNVNIWDGKSESLKKGYDVLPEEGLRCTGGAQSDQKDW
jgi:hypothetical protein